MSEEILAVTLQISIMEGIMSLINEASGTSNDITSVSQINHNTMQEFLNKMPIWDFFEMEKEEFTSKSDTDKQQLVIRYYNALQSGIICYLFLFWFNNDKSVSSAISSSIVRYIIVCS